MCSVAKIEDLCVPHWQFQKSRLAVHWLTLELLHSCNFLIDTKIITEYIREMTKYTTNFAQWLKTAHTFVKSRRLCISLAPKFLSKRKFKSVQFQSSDRLLYQNINRLLIVNYVPKRHLFSSNLQKAWTLKSYVFLFIFWRWEKIKIPFQIVFSASRSFY